MTTNDLTEIYLVPGFLGFDSLGGLEYFIDVGQVIEDNLGGPNVEVRVHKTATAPAGSFHRRAVKLAAQVAETHSRDATSVHFVGHSTGGLDIRVLLSPGGAIDRDPTLDGALDEDGARNLRDAFDKTRSATSVATPHFGSPIASVALRIDADRILRGAGKLLELAPMTQLLGMTLQAVGLVAALTQGLPRDESFLKWIMGEVFSQSPDKIVQYLQHVTADAGALQNLTQEGTNLANSLLIDRESVRYGSIITGTQEPGGRIETADPILIVNTILFRATWKAVARGNRDYPYAGRNAELSAFQAADRSAGLDVGELDIDDRASDGVVPTASQAYGTIIGVFASDHLDCVGHFPHKQPDGTDVTGWVRSGAAFGKDRFRLLWERVADFMNA